MSFDVVADSRIRTDAKSLLSYCPTLKFEPLIDVFEAFIFAVRRELRM